MDWYEYKAEQMKKRNKKTKDKVSNGGVMDWDEYLSTQGVVYNPENNSTTEDRSGLFKKSEGNALQTIGGTLADLGISVGKGALGGVEDTFDSVRYGYADILDVLGRDERADYWRAEAMQNDIDDAFAPIKDKVEKYSVSGDVLDDMAGAVGYIAALKGVGKFGQMAGLGEKGVGNLVKGAMFTSAMGGGMTEAYYGNATDKEALTYGALTGTTAVVIEGLVGGLGKALKVKGFSDGKVDKYISKFADMITKNTTLKNTITTVSGALGEGVEEVAEGFTNAFAKKFTYMSEEDIWDIMKDEKLGRQFWIGTLASAVSQMPSYVSANKSGVDLETGLTSNEQKVVDAEVQNRISEQEKTGDKKLTSKDKAAIKEQVMTDIKKGGISIDTIESVLGGETYNNYKSITDKETSLNDKIKTLNDEISDLRKAPKTIEVEERYTEAKQELKALENELKEFNQTSNKAEIQAQLHQEVDNLTQNDRFIRESYNEKARVYQPLDIDLSKYDAKRQEAIKALTEDVKLNNTKKTHEAVELLSKVAVDRNLKVKLVDKAFMQKQGEIEGVVKNAYITKDGEMFINIESPKYAETLAVHEVLHDMKNKTPEIYTELESAIIDFAKTKGIYDSRLNSIKETYFKLKGQEISEELAREEVAASLSEDYIATDEEFVRNLSAKQPNVFKRIYEELKYLWKIATAGSKEKRQLEKAKKLYDKVYRESANVNTTESVKNNTSEVIESIETSTEEDIAPIKEKASSEDGVFFDAQKGNTNFSLSEDMSIEEKINSSMTMKEAKDMLQRAYNSGDIRGYRNADEWLNEMGAEDVAMTLESDYPLYKKYIESNEDILNEEYSIQDVLEAYLNGTLTGKVKESAIRLDTSKDTGFIDDRFYAPQDIKGGQDLYNIANQRVTNTNRAEVYKARADFIINAHNKGYIESLGLTREEVNKKLKTWANYTQKAMNLSNSLNEGVATQNRWTGIENSTILNTISVSDKEMGNLVKSIEGHSNEWQRQYITSTMLALDTHINYKDLSFEFDDKGMSSNTALGEYNDRERKIRIRVAGQNTVAHEMGHYIDHSWGRDLGYTGSDGLTGRGVNLNKLNPEQKQFVKNFYNFLNDIENSSDIGSSYKMASNEVFARFVARFTEWTKNQATNNRYGYEAKWYQDNFNERQYREFVKILQEKAMLDTTIPSSKAETRYSLSEDVEAIDNAYMRAVEQGDIETAQRMVNERAEQLRAQVFAETDTPAFTIRRKPAPKKTVKVYKVFTLDNKGRPSALFVAGNKNLPVGVWLDAVDSWHFTAPNGKEYVPSTQNPNTQGGKTGGSVPIPNEEVRQELIKRGFLSEGSKSKSVTALAYRPGWHAGDMPFFPQGGFQIEGSNYPNVHRHNQVVFECELSANENWTKAEWVDVKEKGKKTTSKRLRYSDYQTMPTDSYYEFATNPLTNAEELGKWYIGGSLKINRALTEQEVNQILEEKGFLPQEWGTLEGEKMPTKERTLTNATAPLDLDALGYDATQTDGGKKLLDAVTYDDDGNIIPLSQRFNPNINDIRYSLSEEVSNIAPTRSWGVRVKDMKLEEAPVREMPTESPRMVDNTDYAPLTAFDAFIRDTEQENPDFENYIPDEVEAPYYEPEGIKVDDPFYERDIKDVGNRKVKAYMYENPEVKPFFQQEAQAMLYELENSIKGEKQYNDHLYAESGGEKGWFGTKRTTSDDIAYLLDNFKYTYADIKKGLNAIIEDNGKENNAISKRIEFALNDRLKDGYTDFLSGYEVPANQDYINLLAEKQINTYSDEAYNEWVKSLADLPSQDIAPVRADITPVREVATVPYRNNKIASMHQNDLDVAIADDLAEIDKIREYEQIAEVLDETPVKESTRNKRIKAIIEANVLDKGLVFENLALKTKGKDGKYDRELEAKWNHTLYSDARAQEFIGSGAEGVKSLNDIIAEVENTDHKKDFYQYMYHKHNIDRMNLRGRYKDKNGNPMNNKPVFGDAVTSDVSKEIVEKYEQLYPEFKDFAQDVYDYMNHLRSLMLENGIITKETVDLWSEMYPNYVPINRVGENGLNVNVPLDTGRTGVNAPIKQATGGSSNILPLFDTMASRTLQTYKAIAKNSFGVSLKNALGSVVSDENADIDEVIDSIDSQDSLLQEGKNGKNPTFTVFENGKRVTFEVTKDMYDALKPLSESSILSKNIPVVGKFSNIRRGLITEFNPVFMLTNPIKDVQDVLINSQHPAQTYKKIPEAFAQIKNKGYWYNEYVKNGGSQNSFFDNETGTFKTENKGLSSLLDKAPLKWISQANQTIEMLPRLAEYIASREAGASVEVSMLDAARVTTNFRAGGDVTKFMNRNGFTFLNASVQGAMQQVRNVREAKANGMKGFVNLATKYAIAGLPVFLLNRLLWDDDEDYEELSDYVKQNYYVLWKGEDGEFVRIPKGRMLAVIQDGLVQMENLVTGNDEVDMANFLKLVVDNIAPANPMDNNVIAPFVQATTNTTWYGEDLVPTRLQDLPNAEQYDESTDSFSKWLGGKTNISPVKINYLLDQYSGGIGDVFLPMMTPEAESGSDSFGEELIAPIRDKFTTDSTMNNQNVSDFYDMSDELTKNANSSKATDEDKLKSKYFNAMQSQVSELYKQKREIQNSKLSNSEKYNKVKEIQKDIVELTKEALKNYSNVSIDGNYAVVGGISFRYNNGEWTKISENQSNTQEEAMSSYGISGSEYWSNKDEYSFAVKNPEKYELLNKNNVTYEEYSNNEEVKDAYNWAYNNPEKYAVSKVIADDVVKYKSYTSELNNIKADKDKNGKTINGSRKEKVLDYIGELDIDNGARMILFKTEYPSDNTFNEDIVEYLNNRSDISYQEMKVILEELGFNVTSDGRVSW